MNLCHKEECAWWYTPEECCGIFLIAANLNALAIAKS